MILVNNKKVKVSIYAGGEVNVNISDCNVKLFLKVFALIKDSDDLVALGLTIDAINVISPDSHIELHIPYLPYARQDRLCEFGGPIGLRFMINFIKSLGVDSVELYDPHTLSFIADDRDRYVVHQAGDLWGGSKMHHDSNGWIAVAPDDGAENRVRSFWSGSGCGCFVDSIFASKLRGKDGSVTVTFDPAVSELVNNKNLMIVDDICDGGRTFIETAKLLKELGANKINLAITTGIFSYGLEPLKEYIDHIYCQYTFLKPEQIDTKFLTMETRYHEM